MKIKLKTWKVKIYIIAKEFFYYSLFTYLIILIAEIIKEGIASYFFNLNILLGIVIISGLIMTITYDKKLVVSNPSHKKIRYRDIFCSILLALGGGLFVFAAMFDLGTISIVLGVLAALLIFLLSLLLLTNRD